MNEDEPTQRRHRRQQDEGDKANDDEDELSCHTLIGAKRRERASEKASTANKMIEQTNQIDRQTNKNSNDNSLSTQTFIIIYGGRGGGTLEWSSQCLSCSFFRGQWIRFNGHADDDGRPVRVSVTTQSKREEGCGQEWPELLDHLFSSCVLCC